jgi:putative ABC transport system permease protein
MRHLALKNLQGRKAYSAIIIIAVAVAAAMTLFTLFTAGGVRRELENSRRMLGPDLAVVPTGSKEKGQIYVSKGPPVQGALPADALERIKDFPELEAAAPQKRLEVAAAGAVRGAVRATFIGFDPATDFTVRPWLDIRNTETFPGREHGLVLGAQVPAEGLPAGLAAGIPATDGATTGGRLLATGTFMDTAVFVPMPAAAIAAEPAWILLKLRQGVSPDITANRLEVNIPRIEVLRSPTMFKTINKQLYGLLEGGGFGATAALAIIGALLVTSAMFALMVHERKREVGLLKALGAPNAFVFKLLMSEALLLGSAGAVLGAGLAAVCLICVQSGIVGQDLSLGLSGVPTLRDMLATLALTVPLIVAVAVLTALYPALAATRLEPYAAIRSGGQ